MKHFMLAGALTCALLGNVGCGGGGGDDARDMRIRIDWATTDDFDLYGARLDRWYDHPDSISYFNLTGGPPSWGDHSGDNLGNPPAFEFIDWEAHVDEEHYTAFVRRANVSGEPQIRLRLWRDGQVVLDSLETIPDGFMLVVAVNPFAGGDDGPMPTKRLVADPGSGSKQQNTPNRLIPDNSGQAKRPSIVGNDLPNRQ